MSLEKALKELTEGESVHKCAVIAAEFEELSPNENPGFTCEWLGGDGLIIQAAAILPEQLEKLQDAIKNTPGVTSVTLDCKKIVGLGVMPANVTKSFTNDPGETVLEAAGWIDKFDTACDENCALDVSEHFITFILNGPDEERGEIALTHDSFAALVHEAIFEGENVDPRAYSEEFKNEKTKNANRPRL